MVLRVIGFGFWEGEKSGSWPCSSQSDDRGPRSQIWSLLQPLLHGLEDLFFRSICNVSRDHSHLANPKGPCRRANVVRCDHHRHDNATLPLPLARISLGILRDPSSGSCRGGIPVEPMTYDAPRCCGTPLSLVQDHLLSLSNVVMHETHGRHTCTTAVGVCRVVRRVSEEASRTQSLQAFLSW